MVIPLCVTALAAVIICAVSVNCGGGGPPPRYPEGSVVNMYGDILTKDAPNYEYCALLGNFHKESGCMKGASMGPSTTVMCYLGSSRRLGDSGLNTSSYEYYADYIGNGRVGPAETISIRYLPDKIDVPVKNSKFFKAHMPMYPTIRIEYSGPRSPAIFCDWPTFHSQMLKTQDFKVKPVGWYQGVIWARQVPFAEKLEAITIFCNRSDTQKQYLVSHLSEYFERKLGATNGKDYANTLINDVLCRVGQNRRQYHVDKTINDAMRDNPLKTAKDGDLQINFVMMHSALRFRPRTAGASLPFIYQAYPTSFEYEKQNGDTMLTSSLSTRTSQWKRVLIECYNGREDDQKPCFEDPNLPLSVYNASKKAFNELRRAPDSMPDCSSCICERGLIQYDED